MPRSEVITNHAGSQMRAALSMIIYQKALRLTPSARQGSSTGQIINLFSTDAVALERFMRFVGPSIVAPCTVAACLYLIDWREQAHQLVALPRTAIRFGKRRRLSKGSS